MKTQHTRRNLKERIISAALALAMVTSLLPGGFFPKAQATAFDSSLTIYPDGSFEATFSNGGANDAGNWWFALVPDISTGSNHRGTIVNYIKDG